MTETEDRRRRLNAACALAEISKAQLAGILRVTPAALGAWERRGDPPEEPPTPMHKAGRAQYDRPPLSSGMIAAALAEHSGRDCPAEALRAGSHLWPEWTSQEGRE